MPGLLLFLFLPTVFRIACIAAHHPHTNGDSVAAACGGF